MNLTDDSPWETQYRYGFEHITPCPHNQYLDWCKLCNAETDLKEALREIRKLAQGFVPCTNRMLSITRNGEIKDRIIELCGRVLK